MGVDEGFEGGEELPPRFERFGDGALGVCEALEERGEAGCVYWRCGEGCRGVGQFVVFGFCGVDGGLGGEFRLRKGCLEGDEGLQFCRRRGARGREQRAPERGLLGLLARAVEIVYRLLDSVLNGIVEDLALAPDLDDAAELLLDVVGCAFVGCRCGFGDDGREGGDEFVLLARFRLLDDFVGEVDQV